MIIYLAAETCFDKLSNQGSTTRRSNSLFVLSG